MKTDINGVAQCPAGKESFERFSTFGIRNTKTRRYVQYDYRDTDGELFTTIAPSLKVARARCAVWLAKKEQL